MRAHELVRSDEQELWSLRNHLVALERDGERWVGKQADAAATNEPWFYRTIAPALDFVPSTLVADERHGLVVMQHAGGGRTLQDVERAQPVVALSVLAGLGPLLGRLHALELSGRAAPEWFPSLDPIDHVYFRSLGGAARELLRELQGRPALVDTLSATAGEEVRAVIHGDLKYDNVMTGDDGSVCLIDWELCGDGPVGWDVGAALGMMVATWARSLPLTSSSSSSGAAGTVDELLASAAIPFEVLSLAVASFMDGYRRAAPAHVRGALSEEWLARHVAAFLVRRSWQEVSLLVGSVPVYVRVRLALAEGILDSPDTLFQPSSTPAQVLLA